MWLVTGDMWHTTCDTWHVTRDMGHLTHDIWGEVNLLSKFQLTSSTVWEWSFVEDIFTKDQWVSDLKHYKGVCTTDPATPGLLIINHTTKEIIWRLLDQLTWQIIYQAILTVWYITYPFLGHLTFDAKTNIVPKDYVIKRVFPNFFLYCDVPGEFH